ncbi:hypothetical protein BD770DRAFT_379684 [Pilaira anomala]|nr:hypothetical protein BD770DRAFT_379684 [Pilaira anomala]
MDRTALIFGATGAVGKQVLIDALKNGKYAKVITAGRRPVQLDDTIPQNKLVQKTIDFENLEAHREVFRNINDVFCCLGTSLFEPNTEKIEKTYVLNAAKIIAEENKPSDNNTLSPIHYLYCSSAGADTSSMISLLRIKAEAEEGLKSLGFQKVSVFLPGGLKTVEPRSSFRWAEFFSTTIFSPFDSFFNLKLLVSVDTLGKAMRRVAEDNSIKPSDPKNIKESSAGSTVHRFSNIDIIAIASDKK